MTKLAEEGFRPLTEWTMRGDRLKPVKQLRPSEDKSGWLYAFVIGDEVMYVGKTDRVLRSRLSEYSYNRNSYSSQLTQPERVRGHVKDALARGLTVEVHGRPEPNPTRCEDEERRLKTEWHPPWNLAHY